MLPTHINRDRSRTPPKRKLPFTEESPRSAPSLRDIRPQPDRIAPPRLNPNPYSADQMATIPQPRRLSPTTASPTIKTERLPSILDMVPELPSLNRPSPSSQSHGPDSFQPSGPTTRPAAGGLAPTLAVVGRTSTAPIIKREYATSTIASGRVPTSRSSPILPPLSAGFGPSVGGRTSAHAPYSAARPSPPRYSPVQPLQSQYRPGSGASPNTISYAQPLTPQQPSSLPYAHYDTNNDYRPGDNSKRRRGNLPKAVTDTLRKWFNEHIAHPYPTEDEKMMLMNATNLTMSQISNWFINARRRSLPQGARDGEARDGIQIGYISERV